MKTWTQSDPPGLPCMSPGCSLLAGVLEGPAASGSNESSLAAEFALPLASSTKSDAGFKRSRIFCLAGPSPWSACISVCCQEAISIAHFNLRNILPSPCHSHGLQQIKYWKLGQQMWACTNASPTWLNIDLETRLPIFSVSSLAGFSESASSFCSSSGAGLLL